MLKTVKNGCGIRVDPPPPLFLKIPPFSRFFLGGSFPYHFVVHLSSHYIVLFFCSDSFVIQFGWFEMG